MVVSCLVWLEFGGYNNERAINHVISGEWEEILTFKGH